MKKYYAFLIILAFASCDLWSETADRIQTIDGSQRNRISAGSSSSASGVTNGQSGVFFVDQTNTSSLYIGGAAWLRNTADSYMMYMNSNAAVQVDNGSGGIRFFNGNGSSLMILGIDGLDIIRAADTSASVRIGERALSDGFINVLTWTNRTATLSNLTVLGTIKINTSTAITGSVTNVGPGLGSSNVIVFANGIITNRFTIP